MPQKENSTFVVNSSSQSQTSKSLNDSLQDISSFSDNEQYQNLEESEEEEYIESDSVTQFKFKEYIDFPKMSLFDRPQGYIQPIPEDYIFKDLLTYLKTMNILEKERFFKKIRDSLKKNVFKREDRLKNEREVSTYEDFQWIQDYEVADIQFSSNGLILLVNSSMKIQKYQQKQWEILNNQIMIFVNKKTKKFFVGKTIDQNDKQQSEIQKLDESSIQNESFQLLVENVKKNELYKDITIDEIKEVEDILKEDCNDFDIINLKQTFQIKMNLLTDIKEFLININQISQNYILLTPHEYWFQTQQILNCQQNFSKLQQIQFYDQTINGQKGESKFPEYGFLNGRDDLKQEFMQQMEQQIQNLKELDKYQLQALIYALHNQNAIIQGPPGTGKTYLASHLINTLSNLKQKYCNKPILIISKKNCSLDQLLIQLKKIKSKKKLLRLGYQTTLKEIEKYTVSKQKGPQKYPIYQPGSEQLNEKLQNYIERDKDQDYYQACNSQAQPEEDIDNLSFQIYAKEKEMEGFLQEMRSYEYSNLKNQVVYDSQYQRKLANFMKKFQFIVYSLTQFQLEINWYRRGQYQNNQCSTCQERFHIGVCKYASQETNLFDYFKQMFLQFNQQSFQDNQILIFEQEANQNNLRQEVDISQIYQDQTISPKSCSNEFLSIQELINMMGSFVQDKNQNNIKEINKQKAFLTEDESEISFKCTKKQKQKISQKQRKQNQKLSLTQNIQTNLNNSNSQ
ncbi:hypothetical protein ABPG73_012378 [Tetrahymena malaccensis]